MHDGDVEEFEDSSQPDGFDLAGWWVRRERRLRVAHRVALGVAYGAAALAAASTRPAGPFGGLVATLLSAPRTNQVGVAFVCLVGAGALVGAAHLAVFAGHEVSPARVLFDWAAATALAIGFAVPLSALLALGPAMSVIVLLAALGAVLGLTMAAHR
jgi:hypothetical protein